MTLLDLKVRHPMLWLFKSMCRSSYNVWSSSPKHATHRQQVTDRLWWSADPQPPLNGPACAANLINTPVRIGKFNTGVCAALYVQNTYTRKRHADRHSPTEKNLNGYKWILPEESAKNGDGDPGCNACLKIRRRGFDHLP